MLVSAQIVFLNTVKSDPTRHSGPGDVGDLWISELDVSTDRETIDNIGISHVNATDDWVNWPNDGAGYINASWTVDIEGRRPEYYVIFSLVIYNTDDECKEVGNDSFSKSYDTEVPYDESGTLSVYVQFTEQQQQAKAQILVCYLSSIVKINDTAESENFTVWADDRSIVPVEFNIGEGEPPPFSIYTGKANEIFPSMWSWIPGWPIQLGSEENMLNTQTFFKAGTDGSQTSGSYDNPDWDLGDIDINLTKWSGDVNFTKGNESINWSKIPGSSWLKGRTFIDWKVWDSPPVWHLPMLIRYRLMYENTEPATTLFGPIDIWFWWGPDIGQVDDEITVKDLSNPPDDVVDINGRLWVRTIGVRFHVLLSGYTINIVNGTASGTVGEQVEYFWEEECAYQNDSYAVSVTNSTLGAITTIDADISNVLAANNEYIYTFAADNGDTRIEISC